jgi:hypothetical protein
MKCKHVWKRTTSLNKMCSMSGLFYLCGTVNKKYINLGHWTTKRSSGIPVQQSRRYSLLCYEFLSSMDCSSQNQWYLEWFIWKCCRITLYHSYMITIILPRFFQDGSLPLYYTEVCACHNPVFPRKWIVHAGPILWPQYCPDLTLLELWRKWYIFLWCLQPSINCGSELMSVNKVE